MKLFSHLDIETSSLCNRVCPTCIRNSHPNREALKSWFQPNFLSENTIYDAVTQAVELGFSGELCLSHYNEPLMDFRLPRIIKTIKTLGEFREIYLHTNGDFLNKSWADRLDGELTKIIITLYMKDNIKRGKELKALFSKTDAQVVTQSKHVATHFSPSYPISELANAHRSHDCRLPESSLIINHRGQYLLCCDDVIGNFDLGTFPEVSLEDYWFGEKHQKIVEILGNVGGRESFPYCSSCPRV